MNDKEKAQLFDALAENPWIGITIINKDGTTIFRSKINEELTGIKNSAILGKHYSAMPHYEELLRVLEKGVPSLGIPFKTVDGAHALIHRIPLKKENNEIIGALSIMILKDIKEMKILIEKYHLAKNRLKHYDQELRRLRSAQYTFEHIIGNNNRVITNKKLAKNYAKGNAPVLITGETGTGKELFAHAIHLASKKNSGPFIRLNCGAIPEELLESELFGYEEGAFTGAKKGVKIGKFELANHGTIFLDEISSLHIGMQPKLLTVLQNQEIERIGGNKVIKLDFRVVSATNKNLKDMMDNGSFRSDLFYRLNVLNLDLLPLRKRKDDIPLLANHFLKSLNDEYGLKIVDIDQNVFNIFSDWAWPGNIRELRNILERAVQVSDKKCIKAADLPDYMTVSVSTTNNQNKNNLNVIKTSKDNAEKKLLESAMVSNNRNKSRAARQLGISRSHLYALLKKYHMHQPS